MFFTRRCLETAKFFNDYQNKYYDNVTPLRMTLLYRRWRKISRPTKCLYLLFSPVVVFTSYIGICIAVHEVHSIAVDSLFVEKEAVGSVLQLEDWYDVRRSLQLGDIILLKGTGSMSWKITNAMFALSGMKHQAMKYSHVAMVVKPYDAVSDTGPMVLEAVDNHDISVPSSYPDEEVRYCCVQVVDATNRISGLVLDDGDGPNNNSVRPCYNRIAVRHLVGLEWDEERRRTLRQFVDSVIDAPLQKSLRVMLAPIHPFLVHGGDESQHHKVSELGCAEVVAMAYEAIGAIQRFQMHTRSVVPSHLLIGEENKQATDQQKKVSTSSNNKDVDEEKNEFKWSDMFCLLDAVQATPAHFAQGLERHSFQYHSGVSLSKEVRTARPRR